MFRTLRLALIMTAINCLVGCAGLLPAFVYLSHPCPAAASANATPPEDPFEGWVWRDGASCNLSFV